MKRRLPWLILPITAFAIDWASKMAILARMQPGETHPVIPYFFNLHLTFNRGAIFGFMSGAPDWVRNLIFTLAGLGALAYFGYEFLKSETHTLQRVALGLILGGALGNGFDRLMHGHVVDFLDFVFWGWHYWTFNIADSFIVCGAILLGICLFKYRPSCACDGTADQA